MSCIRPTSSRLRMVARIFVVVLGATTGIAAPTAAQTSEEASGTPPVIEPMPGPVVDGRHRQPSRAEIESRELAQGRLATAIRREDRAKDRAVDEIYRELKAAPGPDHTTAPEPGR